jgi:hypothetical protein
MRDPGAADGERHVIQAPAHLVHLHCGAADRTPGEFSVKLGVAGAVGGRQPQLGVAGAVGGRQPQLFESVCPAWKVDRVLRSWTLTWAFEWPGVAVVDR